MTLHALSMDMMPLSEILEGHHLGFEASVLEMERAWDDQHEFSATTEPDSPKRACTPPTYGSEGSQSYQDDSLGTVLPANWGVHILTLLSKSRVVPVPDTSAASATRQDAQPASSAQAQSQITLQEPDKASKQREKNKRAQKRHRDRQKAKEEGTSQQLAMLAAEVKRLKWEKTMVEQQADTLKTALAARPNGSAEGALVPVQPNTNYEYWPSSGWIPQAVMRTTLHSGSPELMTAEQIKEMTVSDHQCLWRRLVFKLASLLPAIQGGLDSPAGVRMQELVVEHGMRVACFAAFDFDGMHQLATSNMETGMPAGPTSPDRWRAVAAAAAFTDAQQRQIFKVRRQYYRQAGAIASARSKLAPWLQAQGLQQGSYYGLANQFVTSHTAAQQLQENLVQEQNLFISLLGSIWRRTCTQMQTAVMLVQSYPLAVDVVSMMNCMAEDAGEPSLGDLLSGYAHNNMILEREALRVPSPDLLLEVAHWNIDYPKHSV